jgi:1-deoxy-D-xylulose-5-phosphate reductoisomerase
VTYRQNANPRRVAVLGATGSIGLNGLDVIASSCGRLVPVVLTTHRQTALLARLARRYQPECVVVTDQLADRTPLADLPKTIRVFFGLDGLDEAVSSPDVDIVLSAIVGGAGLRGTWRSLEAGKTVALANKESLVLAGPLLFDLARKTGGRILPVDSEHSAIWQALASRFLPDTPYGTAGRQGGKDLVRRLILTASGGPFWNKTPEELTRVTVSDALAHPTWKMGKKISVDSATMMNKAFEIIEARWLFDLPSEKIDVVIHPQSIIHSMVEYVDGAVIAQLGTPDMRLPIQLALSEMNRAVGSATALDWASAQTLELIPLDEERFAAIPLGRKVAADGGSVGTVLSAANEVAVAAFLEGKIPFCKIVGICQSILEHHQFEKEPGLERLFELDRQARRETQKWISD